METWGEAVLDALPGKKPLIKLTYRPPNYETPIEYFRTAITPNDAFFVRYHLVGHSRGRRRRPGGSRSAATAPTATVELTLDELKKMPATEVVAVNQCSGNRRGLFEPHVAGRRMGLRRDGLRALEGRAAQGRARQGRPQEGGDRDRASTAPTGRVTDKTPDFVKSIPVWKAIEETTLIAYEMNGAAAAALERLPGAPRSCRAGPAPTG